MTDFPRISMPIIEWADIKAYFDSNIEITLAEILHIDEIRSFGGIYPVSITELEGKIRRLHNQIFISAWEFACLRDLKQLVALLKMNFADEPLIGISTIMED